MTSYTSYLLQTVVTLVVISGAAIAMVLAAKKAGIGRPSGPIELVGSLPLDARKGFYLVRVGKKVFLVGSAEGGFSKLGEFDADDLPAVANGSPRSFRETFMNLRSRSVERSPDRALGANDVHEVTVPGVVNPRVHEVSSPSTGSEKV